MNADGNCRSRHPAPMDLAAVALAQAGAFSRDQALAAGQSQDQIARRLASGRWTVMLPAVYRHAFSEPTTLTAAHAVLLSLGPVAVLSHFTAAWLLGLMDPSSRVHVTAPIRARPRLPST